MIPQLEVVAARAARLAPPPHAVASLAADLRRELGADRVSTVESARRAASNDYAHLSPVLSAVLPAKAADVVVYPRSAEELRAAVALAYEHAVPIVPRGKGTGNYGQAVPLAAGLVIDLSGMDSVLEMGEGWIRAEAGTSFVALEAAAKRVGQEVAMLPTTVGSTIGGFLAGGAGGMGSIEHGWLWEGFALTLDVVTPMGPLTLHGAQCVPYLHAYGVNGIIAVATVRLAPLRSRTAVMASYESFEAAVHTGQRLLERRPAPRLVSIDDPGLAALYPLPTEGRYSLRAAVDDSAVDDFRAAVEADGGRVDSVDPDGIGYLSTLAFNHVTLRARKVRPDLCHLQVGGDVLVRDPDAVRSVLPGSLLHLDGFRHGFGGLLLSSFQDTRTLYDGIDQLREMGVFVVDPHTWMLGGQALPAIRETAVTNDPKGLLNPGKLPA
ncbi:FAD-binding oxidoreductase [Allorhizocola rhizosphaerae]|uniref:FAD-binding oxidoreductase n=1 Tax=Allorhizocola rhizosphaerae TaxID=1872709 RepID=UPI000E3BDFB1|nr:FAD-binding oxidoreductase [Allorhizocola rhizosphaerae]